MKARNIFIGAVLVVLIIGAIWVNQEKKLATSEVVPTEVAQSAAKIVHQPINLNPASSKLTDEQKKEVKENWLKEMAKANESGKGCKINVTSFIKK